MRSVRTPEKGDKESFVDFGDDPAANGYLKIYLKEIVPQVFRTKSRRKYTRNISCMTDLLPADLRSLMGALRTSGFHSMLREWQWPWRWPWRWQWS